MSTKNAYELMTSQNRRIYTDKWNTELSTADFSDVHAVHIGHMVAIPTQFYTNLHPRKNYCLQYVVRGQGEYFVNNRLYHLTPHTLWLIPKDAYYYYVPSKDDPYEYFWIHLDGSGVEKLLQAIGISEENPVLFHLTNPNIQTKFLQLIDFSKDERAQQPCLMLSCLYALLHEILTACSEKHLIKIKKPPDRAVDDAIAYIKAHYNADIYLDELAKAAKLEKVYFTKKFKKTTGLTPMQFLIHYRISEACRLLHTDACLQEVATRCGFNDFTNFLHRFKQLLHVTPTQYRKSIAQI